MRLLVLQLDKAAPKAPIGPVAIFFETPDVQDAWLVVEWASNPPP